MNSRVIFLIGLSLGLFLALATSAFTASSASRFTPLFRPANNSELEWRLTRARLNRVESQVEGLPHLCCVRWSFDPTDSKIKGRLMSGPDAWKSLSLEQGRQLLEEAALFSIADVKAELEQGPNAVKTDEKDYEIEFVALEKNTAHFKVFATYVGGKLELTDKDLK